MEQAASHNQLIRQRLMEGGSITGMEALRDFGCYRLASRISDLRREGLNIEKTMETGINKVTGKPVTYARYYLSKTETKERPNL
ncbi:helix-turn-helix domain-containing protein [Bacteroides ovatus]|uniref:helix-turn-helix domain-containing protein n=1 Tax=Bacteroides ovatus TaxID=28116 RepID=UPI0020A7522D|nr:helix-turn-helix domain-containing protein [Bacteroides ovatus]CAG9867155.1 hypothetical protein BOVAC1_1510 [Bacteroides ovatus]